MADLIDRAQTSAEMVKHAKGTTVIGGQTFRTIKLEDALDAIAALPAQGVIPRRLVPELIAWAKDEQQNWPMETAYQDDLAAFLAALARAEAGGVEACRCGSDVTDMDGHIVHDDDCPESWQSQATIRKSQTVAPAPVDALVKAAEWQWRSRIKGGAWDAWENGRYGQPVPPFMEVEERATFALAAITEAGQ